MTDSELDPLRRVLAALAPQGRRALLPALHAAQRSTGWLAEPVSAEVGRALGVPLADLYGVIDFYAMFQRQPAGRTLVRVCSAPVCALAGSEQWRRRCAITCKSRRAKSARTAHSPSRMPLPGLVRPRAGAACG